MEIKYEIATIKNAGGSGVDHKFVRLHQPIMLTSKELETEIEHSSTLTAGDIRSAFAAIHRFVVRELSYGNRVFIPGLGYLSLSAGLHVPEDGEGRKITGGDVFFAGINFRPTREVYEEVEGNVRFVRAKETSQSAAYDAAELWGKTEAYIRANGCITASRMRSEFGLSRYMAEKWIRKFLDDGLIVKAGNWRSPVYCLA